MVLLDLRLCRISSDIVVIHVGVLAENVHPLNKSARQSVCPAIYLSQCAALPVADSQSVTPRTRPPTFQEEVCSRGVTPTCNMSRISVGLPPHAAYRLSRNAPGVTFALEAYVPWNSISRSGNARAASGWRSMPTSRSRTRLSWKIRSVSRSATSRVCWVSLR